MRATRVPGRSGASFLVLTVLLLGLAPASGAELRGKNGRLGAKQLDPARMRIVEASPKLAEPTVPTLPSKPSPTDEPGVAAPTERMPSLPAASPAVGGKTAILPDGRFDRREPRQPEPPFPGLPDLTRKPLPELDHRKPGITGPIRDNRLRWRSGPGAQQTWNADEPLQLGWAVSSPGEVTFTHTVSPASAGVLVQVATPPGPIQVAETRPASSLASLRPLAELRESDEADGGLIVAPMHQYRLRLVAPATLPLQESFSVRVVASNASGTIATETTVQLQSQRRYRGEVVFYAVRSGSRTKIADGTAELVLHDLGVAAEGSYDVRFDLTLYTRRIENGQLTPVADGTHSIARTGEAWAGAGASQITLQDLVVPLAYIESDEVVVLDKEIDAVVNFGTSSLELDSRYSQGLVVNDMEGTLARQ